MATLYTLENDYLKLQISSTGAAIHQLLYKPKNFHILRQGSFKSAKESGLFPMAPMANRVKGNSFVYEQQDFYLPHHKFDNDYFLHGDAWINEWQTEKSRSHTNSLTLTMESNVYKCCAYQANLTYTLKKNRLLVSLSITNLTYAPFPFGGGFHPFFNTIEGSQVQFDAAGIWLEGDNYLPTKYVTNIPKHYDFTTQKQIPDIWINNGYLCLKNCNVSIIHPNGIKLTMTSPMKYLQVYQPNNRSGFICIEPQSHWVGAHHHVKCDSLVRLEGGESMEMQMTIRVDLNERA
ncbi:aldose 1-epimerase [Vibrio sp. TH_r3]|uniref:aldose epimerase family protein n=1 Tax=Vibrio sp. TH_r3 TaxID=3082084 RepID=UPI002953A83D|nr:aldose 1-epimerase [Vibrio sp. TH_r3]MDV7106253.1 aldose 1-epimerase [Vibrio sp. TH_r3]